MECAYGIGKNGFEVYHMRKKNRAQVIPISALSAVFSIKMSEEDLKNLRAAAKGKLTRVINKLKPLLESKGKAALENEQQINDIGIDLETAVANFNSCHEAYRQATEKAAAVKDLEKVEIDNENYVEEVKTNVYNIDTLAKKYTATLKVIKEAENNIPDAKINFDRSREDYVNAKTLAENVSKQVENKSFSDLVACSDTDSSKMT